MIKKIFILQLILFYVEAQFSINQCTCQDLLSIGDCIKAKCSWDLINNKCAIFVAPKNSIRIYPQYCDSHSEMVCPTILGCAWLSNKCKFFTGCTAYALKNDSECQAISNRCITDGSHCVEIGLCSEFKKPIPCLKNSSGSICYWDTKYNICVDANTCDQLPTTFITDKDCREVIKTCTTITGGGCIESGNNCSDQKLRIQCGWNKQKTIACFWDGTECKDRICDNAPTSLTTDESCKEFRTDGSCTTKANGGCVTRTTCAAAKIKESCTKNNSGGDCFWTGTDCLDRTCDNASESLITNFDCERFLKGCITKLGGGCVANGACSAANVQQACVKNSSNFQCIWDDGCKEKTCANAPKTLETNYQCEAYLPGNNCITKIGGGCITNTTCAAIALIKACDKNSASEICFWDDYSSSCKIKTCANAPSHNSSHESCQRFLNTCTVNSKLAGCVEKACENLLSKDICSTDANYRECIWKGKCYKKQCVLASTAITTHADCQIYHSSCTLSNSGTGCVTIPLKCEAITIEAACQVKQNGSQCGWNGSQCIDKDCSTASKTFTTTFQCEQYISTCVAKNPVYFNGFLKIQGCQHLPKTCAERKSQENCEIIRSGFPICLWVSQSGSCYEKSCATANIIGTTGALSGGVFTFSTCQNYLSSCISNNSSDGCIFKPNSCSSLIAQNCQQGSKANGDCYWNGSSCVDRNCYNIFENTHMGCYNVFNQCTVNNARSACQPLATGCTSYMNQDNCKFTSAKKNCVWTGIDCRNATCADAPDTTSYDSDLECSAYPIFNKTCTVVSKVGAKGCVSKLANCSDYMTQAQCHKTITNLTAKDDCRWIVDKCYSSSQFDFGSCNTFKGTQSQCQQYRLGCTNTLSSDSSTPCIVDCTLKILTALRFQDCQALDSTCSVNKYGTSCIFIQSTCVGYGSKIDECFRSSSSGNAGYCVLNNFMQCQSVTAADECVFVTEGGMNHSNCQLYNSICTSLKDGFGCQEYKSTCSDYATQNNCTLSKQGKCFFSNQNECVRFSNCASITGLLLNKGICGNYESNCVANANGTACQERLATCDLYLTENSCTTSADVTPADKCVWNGTSCFSVRNVATECKYVTGTGLTDEICASYNSGCTVNRPGTACQERLIVCPVYLTYSTCTYAVSPQNKCVWNGTVCFSIWNTATDCVYITGSGLTDELCASYNPGCTVNRTGTACQEKKAVCEIYTTQLTCSISSSTPPENKCVWNGTACFPVRTIAIDCVYITGSGLTDELCASYNPGCTVNRTGTACQERLIVCTAYVTYSTCTVSYDVSPQNKCVWNGTVCFPIWNTATDCVYITGSGLTDEICASYNPGCTVNRTGTACQEKQAVCEIYSTQLTCSISKATLPENKCVWNGTACFPVRTIATDCAYVTGIGLTNAMCASYNAGCTNLKDGTGCQEAKANCKDYTTQNKCSTQTTSSLACLWIDNSCYPIASVNCSVITGNGLDHTQCQEYSTGCTSVSDGTQCQDFKSTCEQYRGTTLNCTNTATSKCLLYGSACISFQNIATDCAKITGSAGTITYEICQSYNAGCSVNRSKSACVLQQVLCQQYTIMSSCYKSLAGLCIASSNIDTTCVQSSTATTCENVYLGTGNYSSANCNEMKAGCTNNGTTACVARTCINAVGPYDHTNCNNYLNTCTVNVGKTACKTMAYKCTDQSQVSCLQSLEGECIVVGTQCVRKTCDIAPNDDNYDDDYECSSYQQSCTVARLGGCQDRGACASYKSQIQCQFNINGEKCFWNPTIKTCVDLSCDNIEASSLYDSHNECFTVDALLACTVRAINGVLVKGCIARGACSSYTNEEQCRINQSNGICTWQANTDFPVCQDKFCTNAPLSTRTHKDCYDYYNTNTVKCTVAATSNNNGDNPILGGCQQTADCSSYIDEEQCQINSKGDPCAWSGKECADKSCYTAPSTADYDNDIKCRAYITNQCTVAYSGQGCVEIPATCEIMTQKQCYFNKAGDPCYWTGTSCITRSCENAPDVIATADECNTYLAGCTLDTIKCKLKICEDFYFTTDDQCRKAFTTCTTNGKNCVTRGSCLQALAEAGCVTSLTGEQCEWIPATELNPAYCTIKNCSTAPKTLQTENECQLYFPNCTTIAGGGCVLKSTCLAATLQSACTTAIDGQICGWNSIMNACRDQDCQDIEATLHTTCKARKSDCTAGANGRCAKIQNCEQTKLRAACIEGLNGPCMWIDQHINEDGSQGACFQYTSCQSLNWSSDQQCKQISNECTTDGQKCVAITQCSETNTNGGCITGYDGICMQSAPALNSSDPEICQVYSSCENAFYITHQQCQKANKNCTTNGTTGCIKLGPCSQYQSQAGCIINKIGLVISSAVVTSTGLCTWDTKQHTCRDQNCSDYQRATHIECSAILSSCTSDGQNCIAIGLCSSYNTQIICESALGTEGICFWENASLTNSYSAYCRQMVCQDIQSSKSNNECLTSSLSCVLDNYICIPKASCHTYTSKTACNSGGLDGICVFSQQTQLNATPGFGTCSLMKECSTANNDQNACQAAKDRCFWKSGTQKEGLITASKCTALTCATNYSINGLCSRLLNWDQKSQQICILYQGTCISIDPSNLPQNDCFSVSGYTYTWNANTTKCQVCKVLEIVSKPDDTPNEEEEINEASKSQNYRLSIIGIIVIENLIW